jgi:hypothetical protein
MTRVSLTCCICDREVQTSHWFCKHVHCLSCVNTWIFVLYGWECRLCKELYNRDLSCQICKLKTIRGNHKCILCKVNPTVYRRNKLQANIQFISNVLHGLTRWCTKFFLLPPPPTSVIIHWLWTRIYGINTRELTYFMYLERLNSDWFMTLKKEIQQSISTRHKVTLDLIDIHPLNDNVPSVMSVYLASPMK